MERPGHGTEERAFDASEKLLAVVLRRELHPRRLFGALPEGGHHARPTLKIVASQRDALYEQVRNHLAGLGDVVVALECQKDYPMAERLAIEFGEDFRLKLSQPRSEPAAASRG